MNEAKVITHQKKFSEEELQEWLIYFKLSKDLLNHKVGQLSGGQTQMIALLRIILDAPDIIILDEPTSSMDVHMQKEVLEFMKKIQKELHLTYILVSHDEEVIKHMCDTVLKISHEG